MLSRIFQRKFRGIAARVAAMLAACVMPGLSHADQTNILLNTQLSPDPACVSANPSNPQTCQPTHWFTEQSTSLVLTYAYGTDTDNQPYIDVKIVNSGDSGWLNLYFQKPLINISQGAVYAVSAIARMVEGSTPASARVIAFPPSGNQINVLGADSRTLALVDSRLSYIYQSGTLVNGELPNTFRPMTTSGVASMPSPPTTHRRAARSC